MCSKPRRTSLLGAKKGLKIRSDSKLAGLLTFVFNGGIIVDNMSIEPVDLATVCLGRTPSILKKESKGEDPARICAGIAGVLHHKEESALPTDLSQYCAKAPHRSGD